MKMSTQRASAAERRGRPRLAVELRCYSSNRRKRWVVAHTVNLSRSGALLQWTDDPEHGPPQPGEELKLDLELPHSRMVQRCLRCQGRVVWVRKQPGSRALVALSIARMSFVTRELPAVVGKYSPVRAPLAPKVKSMGASATGTNYGREDVG
jgi:PilZ domain